MKGLVIDTTVKRPYAAAFDGEREGIVYFDESLSTASGITRAVKSVLGEVGIHKKQLDGVAVVVGPGSFTGIRIGVAFANAFCFGLSIPRFRLTSFTVMQAIVSAPCYAVDAGHNAAYAALNEGGVLKEENLDLGDLPEGTVFQKDLADSLPKGALLAARTALQEIENSPCAPVYSVDRLKPHYMRKSQAERMMDEKK